MIQELFPNFTFRLRSHHHRKTVAQVFKIPVGTRPGQSVIDVCDLWLKDGVSEVVGIERLRLSPHNETGQDIRSQLLSEMRPR
jgi:hypothetical protein